MDIGAINLYTELNSSSSVMPEWQEDRFKNLFEKLTGGAMAEEIRRRYNVKLDVGNCQELIDNCDIHCTNYVSITPQTLKNMEKSPALKDKVMDAIEEFCSQEEQTGIRALSPPVKSAGMIIYPDGRTLYWLEGYPNELESNKNKKSITVEQTMQQVLYSYNDRDYAITEKDLQNILSVMGTGYKRRDIFL
ncbi:MAG: hypothetical protein NC124_13100 [Clostridium sp.]|nr:hypothetical protein [Clostridium sp.]